MIERPLFLDDVQSPPIKLNFLFFRVSLGTRSLYEIVGQSVKLEIFHPSPFDQNTFQDTTNYWGKLPLFFRPESLENCSNFLCQIRYFINLAWAPPTPKLAFRRQKNKEEEEQTFQAALNFNSLP